MLDLLLGGWRATTARRETARSELDALSKAIDSLTGEISSLANERRSAPRSEKSYYTDLIRDAKDSRRGLIDGANAARGELEKLGAELRGLRGKAWSLERRLSGEASRLERGAGKLRGPATGAVVAGLADVGSAVVQGHRFAAELLDSLREITGAGRSTGELEYVPIEGPSGIYNGQAAGNLLTLLEPPRTEPYLTYDSGNTVPCESYVVSDTLQVPEPANRDIELASIEYAKALLEMEGHSGIFEVGGPGLPDMLSVSPDEKLCVTEIKGTTKQTDLHASGLKRSLVRDGSEGREVESLMENSPAWLMRSGSGFDRVKQVLDAIDKAVAVENVASRKSELLSLRDGYREAAARGFNPLVCDRQLVQVGFHREGDVLKPPSATRSQVFDEYVREVQPSRVVQVDVVVGASDASGFVDGGSSEPEGQ
jgi:hypothetical protein